MILSAAGRVCRSGTAASRKAITTTTIAKADIGTKGGRMEPSPHPAIAFRKPLGTEEDLKWRFPADDRTQAMIASVKHGLGQSTYLTFNSKTPITRDMMEEALVHLYDKIESLRVCFRPREGQLWVAEMPQLKLDFQVASGTDLYQELYELYKVQYDLHNGPLWNARLIPSPPDAPCPLPELKEAYPHQCDLVMTIHHAANDGMVVLLMAELLLRILDSLLEGSPVDTRPVGEFRDGVEVREEENRIIAELKRDPERLTEAGRQYLMSQHIPLLMEAYGVPSEENPSTEFTQPVAIDKKIVDEVVARSRSNGTTLNACFTAIFNMSLMEVVREGGLERDIYKISTRHPVDCRRLMENRQILPLGFHSMPFTQCTPTPRDVKKNFWQYVKNLDAELRDKLNRNYMCEQRMLEVLLRPEGFTYEDTFAGRHIPDCDYFFTNLYSPKTIQQQSSGKNVKLTRRGNTMTFHSEHAGLGQVVSPFYDRVRFQVGISTGLFTRRVADRLLEKNISMFFDVSKTVVS